MRWVSQGLMYTDLYMDTSTHTHTPTHQHTHSLSPNLVDTPLTKTKAKTSCLSIKNQQLLETPCFEHLCNKHCRFSGYIFKWIRGVEGGSVFGP